MRPERPGFQVSSPVRCRAHEQCPLPLDHAPFAIDEFELGETQKEADMIETFARGLGSNFFIFTQEGRQFELT